MSQPLQQGESRLRQNGTVTFLAGRYLLVDPIADGGMGSVWRTWDAKHSRYVAVKLLRPADAASLLRFVREQGLRVRHPNVVAPIGWAAEDDQVLLTMDLVAGGNVQQLLGDFGALPPPYVGVLIDQLLTALYAVHGHGITHRDVKPSNLLLELTGRQKPVLRLSDFGIAAVTGEPRITATDTLVGTVGYQAPEVWDGDDPKPAHDVYSAGVVAWQLLTGMSPPRDGLDISQDQPPAHIPAAIWRAVTTLTADDRPDSAATAQWHWRQALAHAAVPGIDPTADDAVEVFDQLGPLPAGFDRTGPLSTFAEPASSTSTAPAPPSSPVLPPRPGISPRRRAAVVAAAVLAGLGVVILVVSAALLVL